MHLEAHQLRGVVGGEVMSSTLQACLVLAKLLVMSDGHGLQGNLIAPEPPLEFCLKSHCRERPGCTVADATSQAERARVVLEGAHQSATGIPFTLEVKPSGCEAQRSAEATTGH